ncbi:hypothetical protein BC940DRAFT_167401 [Gongronella butleri]|nr:hypothetical protein BC940DRAFT_167401 [Gongronella butleri]
MSPTPTGQKNLIMSLVNDKYNGRLYSGSLDKSLIAWDIETENVVNTRRFASPIRHVMQAKHDPNLCLVSHLSDANQFAIVDSRQHHASVCTFGRPEPGKQRRHANPDWHSNGFTIVSPGFDAERIYFW